MMSIKDMPYFTDDEMPINGAMGVSSECQAQLIPDSMTMGRYLELQEQAARKKVSKDFDALLYEVKGGKYSSVKQFAGAVGKSTAWANEFKKVAVSQGLITDWLGCFKRKKGVTNG